MTVAFVCSTASHEALKRDRDAWRALPFVGVQWLDGEAELEMRNCACGSTLCRTLLRRIDLDVPRHYAARLYANRLSDDGCRWALAAGVERCGNAFVMGGQ